MERYLDQPYGLTQEATDRPERPAFADRTQEDQIQVLRREVLQLRAANRHLDNMLNGIFTQLQALREHEHVAGRIMIPATSGLGPLGGCAGMRQAYDPLE